MKSGLRLETRTQPQRTRRTTIKDGDIVVWNNGGHLPYLAFRRGVAGNRLYVGGSDLADFGIRGKTQALRVMLTIASLLNKRVDTIESTDDRLIMVFHNL
jgi:hypothetical protein